MTYVLILRFIGIITIACMNGNGDCSSASRIRVFIPDGRNPPVVCKHLPSAIRTPPKHRAVIAVRTGFIGGPNGTVWSKTIRCGKNCTLFPLEPYDEIFIEGISNDGTPSASFKPNSAVRWRDMILENTPTITDPPAAAFATMTINKGSLETNQFFKDLTPSNPAFITEGTFQVDSPTVTIEARYKGWPTGRKIVVPSNSVVDIMNVLPRHVKDAPESPSGDMAEHHFFLHYELADVVPVEDCEGPQGGELILAQGEKAPSHWQSFWHRLFHCGECDHLDLDCLNASIHCSNSNYP